MFPPFPNLPHSPCWARHSSDLVGSLAAVGRPSALFKTREAPSIVLVIDAAWLPFKTELPQHAPDVRLSGRRLASLVRQAWRRSWRCKSSTGRRPESLAEGNCVVERR